MDAIKAFCQKLLAGQLGAGEIAHQPGVYGRSLVKEGASTFFMARNSKRERVLVECLASGAPHEAFHGAQVELPEGRFFVYHNTPGNALALMDRFPWTRPASLKGHAVTFGCGDRLGIATPGQAQAAREYMLTPILAQQSTRELKLTGRDFPGVVADAAWGVFQENFRGGYGADGDHLKNHAEVQMAIDARMAFITIDLSEHIDNQAAKAEADELARLYRELPAETRSAYEGRYLNKTVAIRDVDGREQLLMVGEEALARIVLTYDKAIRQAITIYHDLIEPHGLDYEISIDETASTTAPEAHFVVANELIEAGVEVYSLAPRFCGEFQKGIDYIGDVAAFEGEFAQHAAIAAKLGYKLSIHSGSDKFSIFPVIGRHTRMKFHHKTSGTSWLQAMRLVAEKAPALYREIHEFCMANYGKVKPLYHITENPANVPDLRALDDDQLGSLFDNIDLRRIVHICYGLVLSEKDSSGRELFRPALDQLWADEEAAHEGLVASHLARHFEELGIPKRGD